MRTCPSCGESIPAQFRLCGFCGTPLDAAAPADVPAPAAPAPPAQPAQPPAAQPPVESRRTVTVVFSDLKGSTNLGERLDPEAVREVMARYFDAMREELARHGGTIEKFIGDAVMAVFGLEAVHEDDALRAVRAAAGMGRALATINDDLEARYGVRLANRTGVNTGEVVAGDAATGQRLVTGDVVNTAARLEQAAPENGILIGPLTHALVRDAVDVEAVEPLALKGKAEPVPAWRLVRVHAAADGRARRDDAPLVGRAGELGSLQRALDEAISARRPGLTVITGDAGVGKSRLVRELIAGAGIAGAGIGGAGIAGGLRGRCLSYGEGITFWAIGEIVRAAAGISEEDPPQAARAKLLEATGDREVAAKVASIVGLSAATFALPEVFWGVRRLLEELARREPRIVVVDDVHWAEPALLELLEHVLDAATDAPLLLVLTARPEFADQEPGWVARAGTTHLPLEPLGAEASAAVVANLAGAPVPDDVARRVVAVAEGNPLFVEQLVEALLESGALRMDEGRWIRADESEELQLPPTIHALVAARLDRVGADERGVVDPASVIGLRFAEAALAELVDPALGPGLPQALGKLAGRRLVRREPASTAGAAGTDYRFQHQVIRDVAYEGILKRRRVALHERFVAWADRVNADRDRAREFEEILGYHLEQAYRLLRELGPLDAAGVDVGRDAARRLASAGARAFERGDMHAAANLLRRAAQLVDQHDPIRLEIAPELAEAHLELGQFAEAEAVLEEAIAAADELFDDRAEAHSVVIHRLLRFYAGEEDEAAARADLEIDRAVEVFERSGDALGLARAWRVRFGRANSRGDYAAAVAAADEVIRHARQAGDRRLETRGMTGFALAALYGPTPVAEAIPQLERLLDEVEGDHRTGGLLRCFLAQLYAMAGADDRARDSYRAARAMLDELGRSVLAASVSLNSWRVEMLAGDPVAAERELRADHAVLEAMGEKYLLSTVAGALAIVLIAQGRVAEAEPYAARSEELATADDVESQALWRGAQARLAARRGDAESAARLAAEAVDAVAGTTCAWIRAGALLDAADALAGAGRSGDARELIEAAREAAAAKGDAATMGIAAAMLDALEG